MRVRWAKFRRDDHTIDLYEVWVSLRLARAKGGPITIPQEVRKFLSKATNVKHIEVAEVALAMAEYIEGKGR